MPTTPKTAIRQRRRSHSRASPLTVRCTGLHVRPQLRCYEPRGAKSCGSPMPRGERIAKPAEWTPTRPERRAGAAGGGVGTQARSANAITSRIRFA
jgi:hypothetical protein